MKSKSVWTAETKLPRFESLKGEVKTDVLIIGGGLCGIQGLIMFWLRETE